jgi:hypothetical protein
MLWAVRFPTEPFHLVGVDSGFGPHWLAGVPAYKQISSYDIAAASERQKKFYYHVRGPSPTAAPAHVVLWLCECMCVCVCTTGPPGCTCGSPCRVRISYSACKKDNYVVLESAMKMGSAETAPLLN